MSFEMVNLNWIRWIREVQGLARLISFRPRPLLAKTLESKVAQKIASAQLKSASRWRAYKRRKIECERERCPKRADKVVSDSLRSWSLESRFFLSAVISIQIRSKVQSVDCTQFPLGVHQLRCNSSLLKTLQRVTHPVDTAFKIHPQLQSEASNFKTTPSRNGISSANRYAVCAWGPNFARIRGSV